MSKLDSYKIILNTRHINNLPFLTFINQSNKVIVGCRPEPVKKKHKLGIPYLKITKHLSSARDLFLPSRDVDPFRLDGNRMKCQTIKVFSSNR